MDINLPISIIASQEDSKFEILTTETQDGIKYKIISDNVNRKRT
jgi:hypothetical protein